MLVSATRKILKGCVDLEWVVVRNTKDLLKDTTLRTWFDWIKEGPLGTWKEVERTFFLRFGDVDAEILFRSLDRPSDISKTLSLEVTGVWFNEAKEIPREIIEAMDSRHGRYPQKKDRKGVWHGMILDTNPPEVDSYLYKVMEGLPIEKGNKESILPVAVFKQPGGRTAEAENLEHLDDDYYIRMAAGKSKEWINVFIDGNYGVSNAGLPVYRGVFSDKGHCSYWTVKREPCIEVGDRHGFWTYACSCAGSDGLPWEDFDFAGACVFWNAGRPVCRFATSTYVG